MLEGFVSVILLMVFGLFFLFFVPKKKKKSCCNGLDCILCFVLKRDLLSDYFG